MTKKTPEEKLAEAKLAHGKVLLHEVKVGRVTPKSHLLKELERKSSKKQ